MPETVTYCPVCRAQTWHVDGICEWADGHAKMQEARREQEPSRPDATSDLGWRCKWCGFVNTRADQTYSCQSCGTFR